MNRSILCIDLKCFYAFAECIDRNLDPYKTPLVVANKKQGNGAITLAVSPYMKTKNVKSRCRLFEIPKDIKYYIVPPRMKFYIQNSKNIIDIYLDYVSQEDLHVYSIDEAFLDVTDYLKLYKKTDIELAKEIMDTIKLKTKLVTTCGIGPNMFLAKAALDNEAKQNKDNISKWTYDKIHETLWKITDLENMWGIGHKMKKNLNNLGIYTVYDLAHYDINKLKSIYGVIGEELHNHANGLDEAIIKEKYTNKNNLSFSNSQILFKDYNSENIKIIICEILDILTSRLRKNNRLCSSIGLGIGYSKNCGGGFYHKIKLSTYTNDKEILKKYVFFILEKYIENYPIRKICISLSNLLKSNEIQLSLFDNIINNNLLNSIDKINNYYGKNTLLNASSLLNDSTIIERNKKIGGHYE